MHVSSEQRRAGSLETVDDVARLYVEEAVRVHRLVRHAVCAPPPVIEDACQFAWSRLLMHRARVRRDTARAWLVRVAEREALRLVRRDLRERSLEEMGEHRNAELDGPPGEPAADRLTPALLDELVEQRARLDSIRSLPERQQRLVWLQGLGFSYGEMSGETGLTRRTVERQLLRARRTLAQPQA